MRGEQQVLRRGGGRRNLLDARDLRVVLHRCRHDDDQRGAQRLLALEVEPGG